ncbi:ubiquitin-conjugating enzyme family protein [Entamoeba histolytica HM-1:IMSS-B]|uniref:Ubiquitin-conjugating enzyme family protein n=8 Tax=Entamoeba TaxID=5758 RepID=C4LUR6_ENTH1|nr:ubiquitin-conjugating enzyme family protein [Entamoeba nuttalli P19]XP_653033.1 ubiquitin-conjugating enzyme family protein [Entamoeba histolytica HM-1:IMSS]EMD47725.1 ubiquitinconjugating enzyme family protein [Entamoeba histolytica KU27]EMH76401.1 ubiquitin-conjugating enzyme family protein [Entamoeba histolytica HM-1:IMSS-B]EMS18002.1 ubiquitin-conjugating enzyme family protein [Entamoeba histolytica HM-3:IMSS]ENY63028.1 ubiquitin-conjugating enzyme family protein, putative [Entamoeba hi|eukprot:XP_008857798.1 ubiquitin-conjugating enzyme family protein [Entamoeba nuttalli P19]
MSQLTAVSRIVEERRAWRKDHPPGFVARPIMKKGQPDLFNWECLIPGKKGTIWENGYYPVEMKFSTGYPASPPRCYLPEGFFHPNVFPNGQICLSILNESYDWKPTTSIKQILVGVQDLLDNPNKESPAQQRANDYFVRDIKAYKMEVIKQKEQYLKDSL